MNLNLFLYLVLLSVLATSVFASDSDFENSTLEFATSENSVCEQVGLGSPGNSLVRCYNGQPVNESPEADLQSLGSDVMDVVTASSEFEQDLQSMQKQMFYQSMKAIILKNREIGEIYPEAFGSRGWTYRPGSTYVTRGGLGDPVTTSDNLNEAPKMELLRRCMTSRLSGDDSEDAQEIRQLLAPIEYEEEQRDALESIQKPIEYMELVYNSFFQEIFTSIADDIRDNYNTRANARRERNSNNCQRNPYDSPKDSMIMMSGCANRNYITTDVTDLKEERDRGIAELYSKVNSVDSKIISDNPLLLESKTAGGLFPYTELRGTPLQRSIIEKYRETLGGEDQFEQKLNELKQIFSNNDDPALIRREIQREFSSLFFSENETSRSFDRKLMGGMREHAQAQGRLENLNSSLGQITSQLSEMRARSDFDPTSPEYTQLAEQYQATMGESFSRLRQDDFYKSIMDDNVNFNRFGVIPSQRRGKAYQEAERKIDTLAQSANAICANQGEYLCHYPQMVDSYRTTLNEEDPEYIMTDLLSCACQNRNPMENKTSPIVYLAAGGMVLGGALLQVVPVVGNISGAALIGSGLVLAGTGAMVVGASHDQRLQIEDTRTQRALLYGDNNTLANFQESQVDMSHSNFMFYSSWAGVALAPLDIMNGVNAFRAGVAGRSMTAPVRIVNPSSLCLSGANSVTLSDGRVLQQLRPSQYRSLPDGTELVTSDGSVLIKGVDHIPMQTSGGSLSVGLIQGETAIIHAPPRYMQIGNNPQIISADGQRMTLITAEQFERLPDGTVLLTSNGQRLVKGVDEIDALVDGNGFLNLGFPSSATNGTRAPLLSRTGRQIDYSRNGYSPLPDGRTLYHLTPDQIRSLPEGTELISMDGARRVIVGVDDFDMDTRFGYTAFGVVDDNLAAAGVSRQTYSPAVVSFNASLNASARAAQLRRLYSGPEIGAGSRLNDDQIALAMRAHDEVPCPVYGCSAAQLREKIEIMSGRRPIDGSPSVSIPRGIRDDIVRRGLAGDFPLNNRPPETLDLSGNATFSVFDEPGATLRLLRPDQLSEIPEGTVLTAIDGERVIVGVNDIDLMTRRGHIAYGFVEDARPLMTSVPDSYFTAAAGSAPQVTSGVLRLLDSLNVSNTDDLLRALDHIAEQGYDLNQIRQALNLTDDQMYSVEVVIQQVSNRVFEVFQSANSSEIQRAALEAYIKFTRSYTDNFRNGGGGMTGYENLVAVLANYDLSDDIRRMANQALLQSGLGGGTFRTSAELRAADTIDFLGRTRRDLGSTNSFIADRIRTEFSNGRSNDQMRALFEDWTSSGSLPQSLRLESARNWNVVNSGNGSMYRLRELGFQSRNVELPDGRMRVIHYNPETGVEISYDYLSSGLGSYSSSEQAILRSAARGQLDEAVRLSDPAGTSLRIVEPNPSGPNTTENALRIIDRISRREASESDILALQNFSFGPVTGRSDPTAERIRSTLQTMTSAISDGNPSQQAAMTEALIQFGRNNRYSTDTYFDVLQNLNRNFELPDNVRRLVHEELRQVDLFDSVGPFVPSQTLREQNTITWLGESGLTSRQLSDRDFNAATRVNREFPSLQPNQRREIFDARMQGRPVPAQYRDLYLENYAPQNTNFLNQLTEVGFSRGSSEDFRSTIFVNDETGITITLQDQPFGPLPSFTQSEQQAIVAAARGEIATDTPIPSYNGRITVRPRSTTPVSGAGGSNPAFASLLDEGVDHAEDLLRLGERLRSTRLGVPRVNPETTHIPEFAEQVEDHLTFFREGIRAQTDTTDVSARLDIMRRFEEEARRRVQSNNVTYEWWVSFNHRLSILATSEPNRSTIVGLSSTDNFAQALLENRSWMTFEGYMQTARELSGGSSLRSNTMANLSRTFRDGRIIIPTIEGNGELSIPLLNRVEGQRIHPIGLTTESGTVDGQFMHPDRFFRHDITHADNANFVANYRWADARQIRSLADHYNEYRGSIPLDGDRRAAFEFGYFLGGHELGIVNSQIAEGSSIARTASLGSRNNARPTIEYILDETWFRNEEFIPAWARESEEGARRFVRMMDEELDAFERSFNSR
ncbi:MAG: hypothetical protein CME65_03280 [Halobacteriovoraceae bacterium]|nr:hypothetical protein [Halobacteriovoraceae bacterium]